jgi:hypothetical protein
MTPKSKRLQDVVDAEYLGVIDNIHKYRNPDNIMKAINKYVNISARRGLSKNADKNDYKDIAQEIYAAAWNFLQKHGPYHNGYPFRACLFFITYGAIRDYNKKQSRHLKDWIVRYDEHMYDSDAEINNIYKQYPVSWQLSYIGFWDGFYEREPELGTYDRELIHIISTSLEEKCKNHPDEMMQILYARGLSTHIDADGDYAFYPGDIWKILYNINKDGAILRQRAYYRKTSIKHLRKRGVKPAIRYNTEEERKAAIKRSQVKKKEKLKAKKYAAGNLRMCPMCHTVHNTCDFVRAYIKDHVYKAGDSRARVCCNSCFLQHGELVINNYMKQRRREQMNKKSIAYYRRKKLGGKDV